MFPLAIYSWILGLVRRHYVFFSSLTAKYLKLQLSQTQIISVFWFIQKPYTNGAMLIAISQFHGHNTSQHVIGLIYIVAIISCLMTYQIYGMVAFDIMNIKYTASWKKERCLRWLQIFIRLLFGGLTFFFNISSIYIPGIPITSHWRVCISTFDRNHVLQTWHLDAQVFFWAFFLLLQQRGV